MLYRPQTPLNSPDTWAIHHIYQWSQVTAHVPVHCSMVWDSPGPGPFGQVTLGQKKMVRTSLSKILTISKNSQTNMLLLIVGQLRYPEVESSASIANIFTKLKLAPYSPVSMWMTSSWLLPVWYKWLISKNNSLLSGKYLTLGRQTSALVSLLNGTLWIGTYSYPKPH